MVFKVFSHVASVKTVNFFFSSSVIPSRNFVLHLNPSVWYELLHIFLVKISSSEH